MGTERTLGSAATALLMASQALAATPPDSASLAYQVSHYQEDPLAANRVASGSTSRYQILVHQLHWQTPIAGHWLLDAGGSYESMSGASPLQTFTNSSGQGEVIMSGASIDEQRTDARLQLTRYFSAGTLAGGLYASEENDYSSRAWNAAASIELNQALTTINLGFSHSDDQLSPTDPQLSVNRQLADGQEKKRDEVYVGVSQILNKYEVIQVTAGYGISEGYLSDPYRSIDRRPDERSSQTLNLMYRFYVAPIAGAVHLDYRFYTDNWDVDSHTLEARWLQKFGRTLRGTLGGRYYRQSAARFYSLSPTDSGGLQSSDARLSSYGALSIEAGIHWQLSAALELSLHWSAYQSQENLGPDGSSAPEAPALVDYSVSRFGVLYRY